MKRNVFRWDRKSDRSQPSAFRDHDSFSCSHSGWLSDHVPTWFLFQIQESHSSACLYLLTYRGSVAASLMPRSTNRNTGKPGLFMHHVIWFYVCFCRCYCLAWIPFIRGIVLLSLVVFHCRADVVIVTRTHMASSVQLQQQRPLHTAQHRRQDDI